MRYEWQSAFAFKAQRRAFAALLLGLPCAARQIGRARRFCRELLTEAGHEAGRGNVVTATVLVGLWLVGV